MAGGGKVSVNVAGRHMLLRVSISTINVVIYYTSCDYAVYLTPYLIPLHVCHEITCLVFVIIGHISCLIGLNDILMS